MGLRENTGGGIMGLQCQPRQGKGGRDGSTRKGIKNGRLAKNASEKRKLVAKSIREGKRVQGRKMRRKHYLIRAGGLIRKQQVSLERKVLQDIRGTFLFVCFSICGSHSLAFNLLRRQGFLFCFDQIYILTGRWSPEQCRSLQR